MYLFVVVKIKSKGCTAEASKRMHCFLPLVSTVVADAFMDVVDSPAVVVNFTHAYITHCRSCPW